MTWRQWFCYVAIAVTTILAIAARVGRSDEPGADYRPRPGLTPGAVDPRVTQDNIATTICVPGYTKTVRPPVSVSNHIKRESMKAYGVAGVMVDYELDHLISLELGGAPADIANLWPEPWQSKGHRLAPRGLGAEAKDEVENALHRLVCAGKMTLSSAQSCIRTDWVSCGEQIGVRKAP